MKKKTIKIIKVADEVMGHCRTMTLSKSMQFTWACLFVPFKMMKSPSPAASYTHCAAHSLHISFSLLPYFTVSVSHSLNVSSLSHSPSHPLSVSVSHPLSVSFHPSLTFFSGSLCLIHTTHPALNSQAGVPSPNPSLLLAAALSYQLT